MSRGNEVPDFYDCEASCLGDLLIEVGWAFVDMSTGDIRSEGHLVRPPSHWDMQRVWDQDAEKLHGFSLGQLRAHGRPPLVIARRMNEVLADRELFSDGPADDSAGFGSSSTKSEACTNTSTVAICHAPPWDSSEL
jgi:hypothetical protein